MTRRWVLIAIVAGAVAASIAAVDTVPPATCRAACSSASPVLMTP